MAKSYMGLSITTLRMLDTFASDAATAAPFLRQPLLARGHVFGAGFRGAGRAGPKPCVGPQGVCCWADGAKPGREWRRGPDAAPGRGQ
jgi:hypothetical protein